MSDIHLVHGAGGAEAWGSDEGPIKNAIDRNLETYIVKKNKKTYMGVIIKMVGDKAIMYYSGVEIASDE